jgi:hypothetical protein
MVEFDRHDVLAQQKALEVKGWALEANLRKVKKRRKLLLEEGSMARGQDSSVPPPAAKAERCLVAGDEENADTLKTPPPSSANLPLLQGGHRLPADQSSSSARPRSSAAVTSALGAVENGRGDHSCGDSSGGRMKRSRPGRDDAGGEEERGSGGVYSRNLRCCLYFQKVRFSEESRKWIKSMGNLQRQNALVSWASKIPLGKGGVSCYIGNTSPQPRGG